MNLSFGGRVLIGIFEDLEIFSGFIYGRLQLLMRYAEACYLYPFLCGNETRLSRCHGEKNHALVARTELTSYTATAALAWKIDALS